jgi:hypothetical protein
VGVKVRHSRLEYRDGQCRASFPFFIKAAAVSSAAGFIRRGRRARRGWGRRSRRTRAAILTVVTGAAAEGGEGRETLEVGGVDLGGRRDGCGLRRRRGHGAEAQVLLQEQLVLDAREGRRGGVGGDGRRGSRGCLELLQELERRRRRGDRRGRLVLWTKDFSL